MKRKIGNVEDVAARHLCMGCGACAGLYPEHIEMVETDAHGRRPRCLTSAAKRGPIAAETLRVCPGVETQYRRQDACAGADAALFDDWGPVLEVWEGHAADGELRFRGSSGGLVTALALYCIERGGMGGALHVKAREDIPFLNESTISTDREALTAGAGSRYGPASPCDRLTDIETASEPVVFIGKPCDVAAASRATRTRPLLREKIGLTIGIFCAGVPSLAATFDLMRHLGASEPARVRELRYRGRGWPGRMAVVAAESDGGTHNASVSYEVGWGDILQKKRQWRCHVCADHTGELADLSVGDPWYRATAPDDPGKSLLVVRTERGRRILRAAIAAGYVHVEQRASSTLPRSQPNLLRTRGSMWGRLLTLRLFGAASPRYPGLRLFRVWRARLSWREKAQSFYGTALRVVRKRLVAAERWRPLAAATVTPIERPAVRRTAR